MFGLWLLWGDQLVHSLQQIEQNDTAVHESYVRGEQTLSKIRTNILLGSIYLRDALIDVPRRDSYRAELTRLRAEADTLLGGYAPEVNLLKDSADVDLIQAVTAVSQGKSFFSPAIARLMLDDYVKQRSGEPGVVVSLRNAVGSRT